MYIVCAYLFFKKLKKKIGEKKKKNEMFVCTLLNNVMYILYDTFGIYLLYVHVECMYIYIFTR